MNFLHTGLVDTVKKLGAVGTISYIGAMLLFIVALQVDFRTETTRGFVLAGIGTLLLVFSGIIYYTQTREKARVVKEALEVLGGVYNRMAEQISTADKDKTVSITMTIDNLPDKISEVIKKSSREEI